VQRNTRHWHELPPSAARLTNSLRDIGHDFPTAIADLVDNSVAAGANRVDVDLKFEGSHSYVVVNDDGSGMTAGELREALRFGTRREYGVGDLGRYGLGLKTAPLSQGRRVTVVTRRSPTRAVIAALALDLDLIEEYDEWFVLEPEQSEGLQQATQRLRHTSGTCVILDKLDRVLPERRPSGGWARRRLALLAERTAMHLSMVFHRFLEGKAGEGSLTITVNGKEIKAWNPFAEDEEETQTLDMQEFELNTNSGSGLVRFRGHVLPPRDAFSSLAAFERLSGPQKWNRQQGLYIYRGNRLVQWGGWNGLRSLDEHTKLARASLDFHADLDDLFRINVAKMRVLLPAELKSMIERPIHELCALADERYRGSGGRRAHNNEVTDDSRNSVPPPASHVGLAIKAAAMELGYGHALREIEALLIERDPAVAKYLGFR